MPKTLSQSIDNQVYRPSKQIVIEVFEKSALVLRLTDQHLIELNPIAAAILSMLAGQKSEAQIASTLAKKYKTSKTEIHQDIQYFFKQLLKQGIVVPGRSMERA